MTTYTPDKSISLDDFIAKAQDEGCVITKSKKETFIGDPPSATNYPHVHVWLDGTIALSVGKSKNQKIGRDEVIEIDALASAFSRFGKNMSDGPLKKTIQWVLASAS